MKKRCTDVTQDIFNKAKNGDEEAGRLIYERHYKLIYHVIWKYTKDPEEVETLFEAGLIGLTKAINTFDPTKGIKFSSYLYRIVNNEILQEFRRRKRRLPTVSLESVLTYDKDGHSLTLEDVLGYEEAAFHDDTKFLMKTINKVIDKHFPSHREVILHYIKGHKQRHIAKPATRKGREGKSPTCPGGASPCPEQAVRPDLPNPFPIRELLPFGNWNVKEFQFLIGRLNKPSQLLPLLRPHA